MVAEVAGQAGGTDGALPARQAVALRAAKAARPPGSQRATPVVQSQVCGPSGQRQRDLRRRWADGTVLTVATLVGILSSAIRLATPYLYAAIGETFGQISGVVNLGVDGIMLVGAFVAILWRSATGSLWLGVLAAIIVGVLMGLLMSVISVTLKAEQGISGIGLYMFGLGLSALLFKVYYRHGQDHRRLPAGQDPAAGRHSGHRRGLLQPEPARLRRVPARAAGLVDPGQDDLGPED